jgi:hypothetical protein
VSYDKQIGYEVVERIGYELVLARRNFPDTRHLMVALTEEVGELAQALLKQTYEGGTREAVEVEAVQVAVMAIRILTEGDSTLSYKPCGGISALAAAREAKQ